ncbi:MAG: hypothetical protein J1E32_04035, partial [Treponema sp.]|nr:hypothetical protein [Treponema sp.]
MDFAKIFRAAYAAEWTGLVEVRRPHGRGDVQIQNGGRLWVNFCRRGVRFMYVQTISTNIGYWVLGIGYWVLGIGYW